MLKVYIVFVLWRFSCTTTKGEPELKFGAAYTKKSYFVLLGKKKETEKVLVVTKILLRRCPHLKEEEFNQKGLFKTCIKNQTKW